MVNRILKTEEEYQLAAGRIYNLINASESAIEPDSPEGEELELLSLLVEKYEQEHHRMEDPDPIEAIKFRMEQMNLKQVDIAPIFGGKTRVSEVFHGKRTLSLKMIILLHRYLGIPLESLVSGSGDLKLESEKREQLLHNPTIRNYMQRSFTSRRIQ